METNKMRAGVFYALTAYIMWGFLPIYWKQMDEIDALLILAYRIATFFVLILIAICLFGSWTDVGKVLLNRRKLSWTLLSALAITINWGTYIYAVNSSRIMQSSIAYYLNPTLIILAGVFFFKEKMLPAQTVASVLAAAGVFIMILGDTVEPPYLALIMASSFTCYGLAKRQAKLHTITALFWETVLTAPFCFIYIIYAERAGHFGLFHPTSYTVGFFLLASGIVTGLPLLLYTLANDRIPFTWMGFCQFLSPCIIFFEALLLYHEPLTKIRLIAFICIWSSAILFLWSIYTITKKLR